MSRNVNNDEAIVLLGIGCFFIMLKLFFLSIYLVFVGFLFQYSLWAMFCKDIPWYGDMLCGFIAAPILLPLTLILFFLQLFGAFTAPIFN